MIWVHFALILLLSRASIAQIRARDDWYAAFSIFGVLCNTAAVASGR